MKKRAKKKPKMKKVLNHQRLVSSPFSKANFVAFILVFGAIGGYILLSSNAAGSTANVFVSANGSDSGANCKRFATAQTNPDPGGTTLCATFNKAYQLASPGDSVEVESGTYSSQTISYLSAKADGLGHCDYMANSSITAPISDYSSCITFRPAVANSVTVNTGVTVQAPYVRLLNLTLGGIALGTGAPVNGLLCSDMHQHDMVADGVTINGAFNVIASHASILNSTDNIGDSYRPDGGTSFFNPCLDGNGTPHNDDYKAIVNSTIENLLQTQAANQAGCVSWQCEHIAAIHLQAGNHVLVDRNKFINNASHNIEAQAELGEDSTDWRITNNYFDTICSQQSKGTTRTGTLTSGSAVITGLSQTSDLTVGETVSSIYLPANTVISSIDSSSQVTVSANATASGAKSLQFGGACSNQGGDDVTASGNNLTDVVYSFNTFKSELPVWTTPNGSTIGGTLQEIGNLSGGQAPDAFHCSFYKSFGSGVALDYNAWASGSPCGTHDAVGNVSLTDPANNNFHIGASSIAVNLIPTTVSGGCPSTDIDGDSRPQGAACDAGADEYVVPSDMANVFVSPNGNDSGSNCKRFAASVSNPDAGGTTLCASFDKAYHLANQGDIVGLLAGTYPYQRLTYDATKTASTHVIFRPYAGATVHSDTIDFGQGQLNVQSAQHVTLQDLILDNVGASVETWGTTNDVLLQNLTGHALQLLGGTNLTVKGGDWGKCTVTSVAATNCTSRMIGSSVLIDGANFHDVDHDGSQDPSDLQHTEGIFIRGCSDCTINHSKFWHNTTFNVFVQNCCSLPPNQNVKIFNSWFAATGSGPTGSTWTLNTAIEVTNSVPGFELVHNSFAENAAPVWAFNTQGDSWVGTNALTAENLYMRGGGDCAAGMTYRNNLYIPFSAFTGQQICDPSEKKVTTFGYVNYTQDSDFDYHITAASAANAAGSTLDSAIAGSDIDGDVWPVASTPDSGADQRVAVAPVVGKQGDLNSDGKVNLQDLSILLTHYGQTATASQGDINGDGKVTLLDLSILLSAYGT